MNLIICLEHRFERTFDGSTWGFNTFGYSFWQRYLEVFESVEVLARVDSVVKPSPTRIRADGNGVSFQSLPYYIGPWQYLAKALAINRIAQTVVTNKSAVLMRIPSQIASTIEPALRKQKHPFGVEVVGNPRDVFAQGAIRSHLRPFFRWWFTRQQRYLCSTAVAVAYVTSCTLQKQYPPSIHAFSTNYSSVEITDEAFIPSSRNYLWDKPVSNLVVVGSLAQPYKGIDVLLDALSITLAQGFNISLVIAGEGQYQNILQSQAKVLGLDQHVRFTGYISNINELRSMLDTSDLFVLPSRTEGLPRAMIEAMARGLPCIGSAVGGIPELLPPEDMVPPNNALALAQKIQEVLSNPHRMAAMSARNLEKAREYHSSILHKKRIEFYKYLREHTEQWLAKRKNG